MAATDDEILRVYARLSAMRSSLPESFIPKDTGDEYNELVSRAETALTVSLKDDFNLRDIDFSNGPSRGGKPFVYVQGHVFRTRLDGLRAYLAERLPTEKTKLIGFVVGDD